MRIGSLEVKGAKKKLTKVIEYFKQNNISTLKDIEDIKKDNIKVFQFWNETGVDIISLEINEYRPELDFRVRKHYDIIIDKTSEYENSLEFKIIKFVMSIVILLGLLGYLFTFLSYPIVRTF